MTIEEEPRTENQGSPKGTHENRISAVSALSKVGHGDLPRSALDWMRWLNWFEVAAVTLI